MMTQSQIETRIAELQQERNDYVDADCHGHDVNRRMATMLALSEELEQLWDMLDEM